MYRSPEPVDADAAAARLDAALRTAIVRRARPGEGERTSVQLSGGLDSTTVGGLAADALGQGTRPTRSYSVVFPDFPSIDEDELITETAAQIGVVSTRLAVRSGSVLQGTLPYVERWGLPPVSPNLFFWNPMLARAAADGTRVMLDGEGGDEVFGASSYFIADTLLRRGPRAAADLVRSLPGGRPDMGREVTWPFVKKFGVAGLAPASLHSLSRRFRSDRHYMQEYVSPATAKAFVQSADGAAWKRLGGPRWWSWLLDITTRGMGVALGYDHIRRRAGTVGILPRHPLSDPDVIETMLSLPPALSFDTRFTRPLVRQVVEGLIPEAVRTRRGKSSFDAMFHASLAGPDLPLARGLLGDRAARVGAYVDLGAMRAQLLDDEPPAAGMARQTWGLNVWRLLTLETWLRHQEDPNEPRRTAERIGLPEPDLGFVHATPHS